MAAVMIVQLLFGLQFLSLRKLIDGIKNDGISNYVKGKYFEVYRIKNVSFNNVNLYANRKANICPL